MRKRRMVDKVFLKIKCPALSCRSADVQIYKSGLLSTQYQCRKCGRIFKK